MLVFDTIIGTKDEEPVIPNPLKSLGGPTTRSMSKKVLESLSVLVKRLWDEYEARTKLGKGSQVRMMSNLEKGGRISGWSGPLKNRVAKERTRRTAPNQRRSGAACSGWREISLESRDLSRPHRTYTKVELPARKGGRTYGWQIVCVGSLSGQSVKDSTQ